MELSGDNVLEIEYARIDCSGLKLKEASRIDLTAIEEFGCWKLDSSNQQMAMCVGYIAERASRHSGISRSSSEQRMIFKKGVLHMLFKAIIACAMLVLVFACQPQSQPQDLPAAEYLVSETTKNMDLPFSDAVRVDDMLFVSGQIGAIPGKFELVPGGIAAETKQAMDNMRKILEENNSSLDHVVKVTVMLADIKEWGEFNSVYVTYFSENRPARSAFGTNGLAIGARVEIECIATLK